MNTHTPAPIKFAWLFNMVPYSISNPKKINKLVLIISLIMCCFLPFAQIDVDPENMLSKDEPTRVFHNEMKKTMDINDLIVIGIENTRNKDGVFNPKSLNNIYDLSKYIQTLTWTDEDDPNKKIGVISHNILSPIQVDAIEAGGPGTIQFDRLMNEKINSQSQADSIRNRALNNPILAGTMISNDHKSLALYIPITSKSVSAQIYDQLNEKIATIEGDDTYHITGLPLAEDVFGIDMFIQMAISAPMAMVLIFILIFYFFRNATLGASALLVAMASVLITMGAFVATGNTIHIMSSMIAIFLMPIAVLDATHILSMFFDKYQQSKNRKKTLQEVMNTLFIPMLYTSLTSAAGFFSLYFSSIPPIQVFGIFVGLGILVAWLLSMTLIPAYIMNMSEERLASFGIKDESLQSANLTKALQSIATLAHRYAKTIILLFTILVIVAVYGIKMIKVNDNPMKWLHPTHSIRVADQFINQHFGGNYLVYLTLTPQSSAEDVDNVRKKITKAIATLPQSPSLIEMQNKVDELAKESASSQIYINQLWRFTNEKIATEPASSDVSEDVDMEDELTDIFSEVSTDENKEHWLAISKVLSNIRSEHEVFKDPELLNYMSKLQRHIEKSPLVGKSNSLPDLVKKLNQELNDAKPEAYVIPESSDQVSEVIVSFENSHEPFRLWHLVTQDYTRVNIWFQVKSGDNQDINHVVEQVNLYLQDNPPPVTLEHDWFGLSFINTVWQQKMVSGMSDALISSMIVVFIIMVLLFRSISWGIISMIPLSVIIVMIYGVIGLMGKDYDMPVAVLSALALGLAVDFAIHFITHAKETVQKKGSWQLAMREVFQEPARAIYRNIIIIAVGFTPLLFASLVPYQTVGILMASIMLLSGFATLIILPAVIKVAEPILFKSNNR
jgi:predicted RND superfamily exporter protein